MMRNGIQFYLAVIIEHKFPWKKYCFLGIIGSLFSLLQFFSSTLCGIASDRYGRKSILLFSMVYSSTSSHAFTIIFFRRLVFPSPMQSGVFHSI